MSNERVAPSHNAGTFILKRRRADMPVELRANILIAAENLREALRVENQSDSMRYVLNALAALEKELSR